MEQERNKKFIEHLNTLKQAIDESRKTGNPLRLRIGNRFKATFRDNRLTDLQEIG